MKLVVHTDGGARGNPGPAAIGVVIEEKGKTLAAFGKRIGEATNNVAEYTAVIEALRYLKSKILNPPAGEAGPKSAEINFILDSVLVANQLMGTFKVKDANLRVLLWQIRQLEQEVGGAITYAAVRREQNAAADVLVNKALDE